MIELRKYSLDQEEEAIKRIIDFFCFHSSLVGFETKINDDDYKEAMKTIDEWQTGDNAFYVIFQDNKSVGFLRIQYKGPIVAWIEDIYVDIAYRGKGIATQAIALAEDIVRSNPNYTAICFDVSPRNKEAMDLYYKLGYTDLNMITMRKEFGKSKRNRTINLFRKKFNY